jgi:hypothetical protein
VTWTKLTEDFPQHPKIVAAGEWAELIHIHALIYSNRFLTDGFIPAEVVPTLTRVRSHIQPSVQALVKLGVWVPVKGGYAIHDFLEYQPSRNKVLAERKRKASAGQAGGLARAKGSASSVLAEPARGFHNPVSVPVPDLSGSLETKHVGRTVPRGTGPTNEGMESIGTLLTQYPVTRINGKIQA